MSRVPPVPENYNVMPPPRTASPHHVATVYNKLTGGGGCEHTAYLAPALCMFCLLSVVLPASPDILS
jgi:hypothetical protein